MSRCLDYLIVVPIASRSFSCRESIMRRATCVGRDELASLGQCIGKFTHSGKFRITVGALDVLSKYAKYKVRKKGIQRVENVM